MMMIVNTVQRRILQKEKQKIRLILFETYLKDNGIADENVLEEIE